MIIGRLFDRLLVDEPRRRETEDAESDGEPAKEIYPRRRIPTRDVPVRFPEPVMLHARGERFERAVKYDSQSARQADDPKAVVRRLAPWPHDQPRHTPTVDGDRQPQQRYRPRHAENLFSQRSRVSAWAERNAGLFSHDGDSEGDGDDESRRYENVLFRQAPRQTCQRRRRGQEPEQARSEEHTSELQSPCNLVCRLLLEKKKNIE